jgi:S1-C subfamily serine protease
VFTLGAPGLLSAAPAPARTLEAMPHSVLRLTGAAMNMVEWTCSAVVVKPGLALTAGHCIGFTTTDTDLVVDRTRAAVVVRKNRILDLAVIAFLPKPDDVALPLSLAPPTIGKDIAVVGFALAQHELTTTFGHVSKLTDDGLALDVVAFHGDSGGAVVNKKLELMGILVQGVEDGAQEQIYAVPLSVIRDFLEGL